VNEVLDPLLQIPGVRCVVLGTPDGVPIASGGDAGLSPTAEADGSRAGADEALCGLVAGWLMSLAPSLGLVAWDLPQRLVLRAARGTIAVRRTQTVLLIALLDPGAHAEDLRLPMEGAIARLNRIVRRGRTAAPPPALPVRDSLKGPASENADNDVYPFASELPG